jgi:hypothetical protein
MKLPLSLFVFALLAGGCASTGGDVKESQVACPGTGGLTRPFSIQTLIRVGQENGVSVKRDQSCSGNQESVESASNLVGDDVQDDDEVEAREGHVLCDIVDLPFAKRPFRVHRTKYASDQETYLDVANVRCAIYPSAAGQIDRLEGALEALAGAPVEQRSCPRARPEPITVARLIAAAKRQGLRLLRDARCMEPGVVAQASTLIPYDSENANDLEIVTAYGEVTCLVRKSAASGAEELETTDVSAGKRFDFRNASCTVLTSQEKEAAHAQRVRATLASLG